MQVNYGLGLGLGLVAPGLGRLKPDTTGLSHGGRPASDSSTFPLIRTPFRFLPWG